MQIYPLLFDILLAPPTAQLVHLNYECILLPFHIFWGFAVFFRKYAGIPGKRGTISVWGVEYFPNHSPTERAKFRHIGVFRAKKVDGKINYFLLQNQSLQHTSTIPRNPGKIKTLIEN